MNFGIEEIYDTYGRSFGDGTGDDPGSDSAEKAADKGYEQNIKRGGSELFVILMFNKPYGEYGDQNIVYTVIRTVGVRNGFNKIGGECHEYSGHITAEGSNQYGSYRIRVDGYYTVRSKMVKNKIDGYAKQRK